MPSMSLHSIGKEIRAWLKTVLFVLVLSTLITVFVFEPYYVSGSSMEPTLDGAESSSQEKGDRVIVFKGPHLWGGQPKYGDIIILDSRVDRKRTFFDELLENTMFRALNGEAHTHIWIKRVIGEPGDILECIGGRVFRNGIPLEEDYVEDFTDLAFDTITVPENHVFVMGDNRRYSKDSRQIGTVPLDHVKGKLILRYFPLNKISYY